MRKILAIVIAAGVVTCAVLLMVGLNNHKKAAKAEEPVAAVTQQQEAAPVVINDAQAEEESTETSTKDAEEESIEADVDIDEIEVKDEMIAADIDEVAYKEDVSEADTQALIEWLEGQPDIDESMIADFVKEFPEVWEGYQQDADGNYYVPLNDESLRSKDKERVNATVELGLNEDPIDDALAVPFTLAPDQVKKIKDSKSGVKIDFTDAEIKDFRTELFKSWLENPILFEANIRLICDQEIGDGSTVYDHYATGRKFLTAYDDARETGKGMNLWLQKNANTGIYYTTTEYQKYVVAFIGLFEDKESVGMALTAQKLDHYNLLWAEADLNSLRKATPADYEDPYAALWFNIHLKNGKIGIRIGANFRDKRPEVFNYQATTKPRKTTATTHHAAQPVVTSTPAAAPVVVPVTPVTPTPTPTPTPPAPTPEYKYPTQGSASQGNAPIGGGKNDDPGPGTWKPDQGNGNGSYVVGTSENPDGANPANYDPGPPADSTDNGTPPATTPITTPAATSANNYSGGSSGSNNGAMAAPPAD